nr:hypothetical protein [Xanthomonadales bacterium]
MRKTWGNSRGGVNWTVIGFIAIAAVVIVYLGMKLPPDESQVSGTLGGAQKSSGETILASQFERGEGVSNSYNVEFEVAANWWTEGGDVVEGSDIRTHAVTPFGIWVSHISDEDTGYGYYPTLYWSSQPF